MRPEEQRGPHPHLRYTVIPRTLIFLTHEEKILMLHGSPTKRLWAGKYNGLGGHVETGESPYRAAVRELYEEAGLEDIALQLRAVVHIELTAPPGIMLFVFTGEAPEGAALRPSAEGTPVWIDRRALDDYPLVEDLPILLPHVLAPGPVVFGHYTLTSAGLTITFETGEAATNTNPA